ncbi:hypothetical protein CIRG_02173 [Coccidioides immitis RMSCC 2394]|uniref:Uncharacterized protein n=1 Tax=Coccidioides immitis RMSCC 2394 TaxID=404692 RepID=A0A0J6Y4U9_COCIT|nr:hypothetical protein CIRG_02173 [Coccidioides immitis RMSCC 2394]
MESREGCGKSFLSLHSPGLVPAQLKDCVASMQQCRAGSPDGHGSSILQFSFLLLATGDLQGTARFCTQHHVSKHQQLTWSSSAAAFVPISGKWRHDERALHLRCRNAATSSLGRWSEGTVSLIQSLLPSGVIPWLPGPNTASPPWSQFSISCGRLGTG